MLQTVIPPSFPSQTALSPLPENSVGREGVILFPGPGDAGLDHQRQALCGLVVEDEFIPAPMTVDCEAGLAFLQL